MTPDTLMGRPIKCLAGARTSRSALRHRIDHEEADSVGVTPDLRRSAVRQDWIDLI